MSIYRVSTPDKVYRPIHSPYPSSKILETVVHEQISEYVDREDLLTDFSQGSGSPVLQTHVYFT